jgi:hypothetical protein
MVSTGIALPFVLLNLQLKVHLTRAVMWDPCCTESSSFKFTLLNSVNSYVMLLCSVVYSSIADHTALIFRVEENYFAL